MRELIRETFSSCGYWLVLGTGPPPEAGQPAEPSRKVKDISRLREPGPIFPSKHRSVWTGKCQSRRLDAFKQRAPLQFCGRAK
jgi:hypothetical protein